MPSRHRSWREEDSFPSCQTQRVRYERASLTAMVKEYVAFGRCNISETLAIVLHASVEWTDRPAHHSIIRVQWACDSLNAKATIE